jgi:hypothetical protein
MLDSTISTLTEQVTVTKKLMNYPFLRELREGGLNVEITQDREGQTYISFVGLSDGYEFDSFILLFRMFIQQGDDFSIIMLEQLPKNDPDLSERWKKRYTANKAAYTNLLNGTPHEIEGIQSTNKDILNTVLYGHYAHRNIREEYQNWVRTGLGQAQLEQMFIRIVFDILHIISDLCDNSVEELLRDAKNPV